MDDGDPDLRREQKAVETRNTVDFAWTAAKIAATWTLPALGAYGASPELLAGSAVLGLGYALVMHLSRGADDDRLDEERAQKAKQAGPWKGDAGDETVRLLRDHGIEDEKILPVASYFSVEDKYFSPSREGFVTVPIKKGFDDRAVENGQKIGLFRVAHQLATRRLSRAKIQSRLHILNDLAMGTLVSAGYINGFLMMNGPTVPIAGLEIVPRSLLTVMFVVISAYYMHKWQDGIFEDIPSRLEKRADKLASLYIGSVKPGLLYFADESMSFAEKADQCVRQHEESIDDWVSAPRCGLDKYACTRPCYPEHWEASAYSHEQRGWELIRFHREMVKKGVFTKIEPKPD